MMNSLGCSFLDEGIDFEPDRVCDCCISHNDGRGLPVLLKNYHGELINWDKLFDFKAERIKSQQQKTIYECENCYHLSEYNFLNERKISQFHFSHCRLCNAKCIYCSGEYNADSVNYDTYPIIKDLIDKGFYKSGGEATFQGGEPTVMKHFDELIELFVQSGTIVRVHTSGIKYSSTVEEALKQDKGTVVISIDSGCSETYKKIKQTDCFSTVCGTIKRYSDANSGNVIIKYIIIPGINDNIKEIDKFFSLMQKFNIKTVALDIEVSYARKYQNKDVSNHIFILSDYFQDKAKSLNINVLIYSFISYVLKNRKFNLGVKNKFLRGLFIMLYNDKRKNIAYGK